MNLKQLLSMLVLLINMNIVIGYSMICLTFKFSVYEHLPWFPILFGTQLKCPSNFQVYHETASANLCELIMVHYADIMTFLMSPK